MKLKTLFLLFPVLIFSSCEKDDGSKDATPCEIKMKDYFKDKLTCSTTGNYHQTHLASGEYEGKLVYYLDVSCMTCFYIPMEGYTCDMEKIEFEDLQKLKNRKQVYNSCTNTFMN